MSVCSYPFCSLSSYAAHEPIYGTAVANTDLWLLLEYTGEWKANAIEKAILPKQVHAVLRALSHTWPRLRIQFIKSPLLATHSQQNDRKIALYVVDSREASPITLHFSLATYLDLRKLDLQKIFTDPHSYSSHKAKTQLLLVCTHGKRDRCCAKFGFPIYKQLVQLAPSSQFTVWQTTHLGGHRFAPTMVCLPHGLCYGRLRDEDLPLLLLAQNQGKIFNLANYRGRTCYSSSVQAAEYFVRAKTKNMVIEDLYYLDSKEITASQNQSIERISFVDKAGLQTSVDLIQEQMANLRPTSCDDKPVPIYFYRSLI